MSNVKRQTSWQEDIARNFSRLFQRGKSQDPEKAEEGDISPNGEENGVSSLSSETSEGDPLPLQEDLELSEAFQGTEEEGEEREEKERSEGPEEGERGGGTGGGGGESSILDDAGGSPKDQPLSDSVPCSSTSAFESDSTTPTPTPPPVDGFFRRLGSLFHFRAEPRTAAPHQPEEQQKVEEGKQEEEEEEETAAAAAATVAAVVTIHPEPSGMTCGAGGDQKHCDTAGGLTTGEEEEEEEEEEDTQQPERVSGEGETVTLLSQPGADLQGASSTHRPVRTDTDTPEKQSLGEPCAEDHGRGYGEGEAPDSGALRDGGEGAVEERRRLALACPPVVTYVTYRGQREQRRMRRRHTPISEGDEAQQGTGSTSGGEGGSSPFAAPHSMDQQSEATPTASELTISKPGGIQTLSTNQMRAPTSNTNNGGAWISETDSAALGPTGSCCSSSSHIPLITQVAESTGSQSAFLLPREVDLASVGGQATDSLPGVESVTGPPLAPKEDSAERTSAVVSETHSCERDLLAENTQMAGEDTHGDTDTGLTEQTETLSAHCVQTGSPSLAAASLSEPRGAGGTAHTHLPAAAVFSDRSQLAPHRSTPLGSLTAEEGGQGPAPATKDSGSGDVLDSASGAGLDCLVSGEVECEILPSEVGPSEDQDMYEETLRLESKMMVDNILRNALLALERIESSRLEEETPHQASEESDPVLPGGREEGVELSSEHDKLLAVGLSGGRGDIHPPPTPGEQTLTSNQVLVEGPRSTPSSGYESIAGSDTDIRSSPGPACESSSTIATISLSDQRQGEPSPEVAPATGHLPEVAKGQQLMDAEGHSEEEANFKPNNIITLSEYSSHKGEGDELTTELITEPLSSSGVFFMKQGLHGDGVVIQIMKAGDEYEQLESVSGITNENKGQEICNTGDGHGYNEAIGVQESQVGDGVVCVTKDDMESNRHSHKQEGVTIITNNLEYTNKLNNSQSDDAFFESYGNQTEPGSLRTDSKHETVDITEANLMSVRPKHTQNSQLSQVRHAVTAVHEGKEKDADLASESVQKAHQTGSNGLRDLSISGDESFVLVETYLAAVIEDGSDSGGEEDGARLPGGGIATLDPTSSRRTPEDLSTSEGLVTNSAPSSGNEDRPQWSSVAYRCDVSATEQQQWQDSETQGHSGGGGGGSGATAAGAGAMAGFHQDLNIRLTGLHAAGRRSGHHPELSACAIRAQTLGPLPHLDFHEIEASFAIIDEEEETDAVFVNDTGPMLSPTSRRAKAYPFSLSPIVEEDGFHGDGEEAGEGLSREDRGLLVPPATEEELRSLSGAGAAEQQASSSSLSVLTLLQSVSERLQSSAFCDTDLDPEEASPRPMWDCFFNRGEVEAEEEGDSQALDEDQRVPLYPQFNRQEGPDTPPESHVTRALSATYELSTGPQDMSPPAELKDLFPPRINVQKATDTPFYQYLKSSSSVPGYHDYHGSDYHDSQHRDEPVPSHSVPTCPSTTTDRGENWSHGKVIPRPTVIHIYDGVTFSGERREVHADQEDSGMVFTQGASVRVLGGCWLLYLEPGFRRPGVVLEEGEMVLTHQPGQLTTSPEDKPTAVTIGSIRRLVKDDSTPEIHLPPISGVPGGGAFEECLHQETDSLEECGPIHPSNLSVKSGCWLAYDRPGFHGNYAVMEGGGATTAGPGRPQVTCVRSLRPLRRGGLKVRRPLDPKMLVFEQPSFQGRGRELKGHTPSLESPAGLKGAGSLRVIGGVWVGYTGEGYTGRQYLLEEGEYGDCVELGGADHPLLLSFRFLQADFLEPSVSLQEETGSPGARKTDILDRDVPDLEKAGATEKTTTICVKNGVWVAYSEGRFSGEQCILEKGKHPGTLDWGGSQGAARSIRPVRLDLCGAREPRFLLRAYSQPHYEGGSKEYQGEAEDCDSPMSFRVIRGSWLLFDEEGCCGNQYVLGEGLYPDLISCGCVATSVKSLRPIPYSFSDPSVSLFSLDSFEGLKTVAETPMEDMKDMFTQSLRVDGGLWVVYEYSHYNGRQMLLQPGEVPRWGDHSGWDTIGSLRPLNQSKVYVHLKRHALDSVLTAERVHDDSSPARLFLSPACSQDLDTQCWVFTGGLLRCKANKACLSVIGGKGIAGSRVALWPLHGRTNQRWSLNQNGTISTRLNHNLVLDFRGGTGFDKDHLVVNEFSADQATQCWDIEMV